MPSTKNPNRSQSRNCSILTKFDTCLEVAHAQIHCSLLGQPKPGVTQCVPASKTGRSGVTENNESKTYSMEAISLLR